MNQTTCNHWFSSDISTVDVLDDFIVIDECINCGQWFYRETDQWLKNVTPEDINKLILRNDCRNSEIRKRY